MPRPKPPAPLVSFHAKLTPQESAALSLVVRRWSEAVAAKLREQGVSGVPRLDRTAWLKTMLREQAKQYGVPIEEPEAPAK